ncbi:hypothetical protein L873DRAFT_1804597 [Choiromyces venosus 120613-1]|uniref:Uncharacterized protein n=1 Tax=Choiromyces venosus 120613-1 TaxID=1336337 RepID=A0A3N4JUH1_9PEZI|nr:hypothetical protein L873DRAFT_1804597 [Choiromyces venosus 120613-1]
MIKLNSGVNQLILLVLSIVQNNSFLSCRTHVRAFRVSHTQPSALNLKAQKNKIQ